MHYDLIFEGGGAKGFAFVGAYEEFIRRGYTAARLLGTSAGAISAVLVAAGYTPPEIRAALDERENGQSVFAGFLGQPAAFSEADIQASAILQLLENIDVRFLPQVIEKRLDRFIAEHLALDPRAHHLFAFVERGGWYGADRFVSWLQAKLDSGFWRGQPRQFSRMTLSEFFDTTHAELSLVASDTTDGRMLVLNHNTAPACPVVWAVRMSMSIPFVWDEVIWQAEWGTYLGRELTDHAIVDGGMLSNFPLELFISDQPPVTRLMGPKQNTPVLGLLIDESLPVAPLARDRGLLFTANVKPMELRTVQRIQRLVNTATGAHDKMVLEAFEHLVVRLPAKGYGTTEFDMSDDRREALAEAGRVAMSDYFERQAENRGATRGLDTDETIQATPTADRIALRLLGHDESSDGI